MRSRRLKSQGEEQIGCLPATSLIRLLVLVSEMLQCAQDCAASSSPTHLTFGEFCLFASELKRCCHRG